MFNIKYNFTPNTIFNQNKSLDFKYSIKQSPKQYGINTHFNSSLGFQDLQNDNTFNFKLPAPHENPLTE